VTDAGRIVADQLKIDAARFHGDQKQIDQANAELAMLRTNADFQRLAGADGFAKLINSADAAAIVGNAKLVEFLRSTDYQNVIADGQRATDLASVMSSDSFRGAIDNASFTEMLKVDGMRDALVSDALRGTAMHYSDQMVQAVDGLKLSE
jgi:hypothetical protein